MRESCTGACEFQLHHLINYSYSPTTLKYVVPALEMVLA